MCTTIGNNAFKNANMENLVLSENVNNINDNAFANCSSLKTIHFLSNIPIRNINSTGFSGTNIEKVFVPSKAIDEYKSDNLFLQNLNITSDKIYGES
jgi:hypothetical protein